MEIMKDNREMPALQGAICYSNNLPLAAKFQTIQTYE